MTCRQKEGKRYVRRGGGGEGGGGGKYVHNVCVCACVRVRERDTEREFWPLSGFRYTGTLRPVPVYRTEATRIGALGITAAYRQP